MVAHVSGVTLLGVKIFNSNRRISFSARLSAIDSKLGELKKPTSLSSCLKSIILENILSYSDDVTENVNR
tara:strand:+ start:1239 stop:1448 length:210 start_codon:yes stop_codon:yes gene_type:complete